MHAQDHYLLKSRARAKIYLSMYIKTTFLGDPLIAPNAPGMQFRVNLYA